MILTESMRITEALATAQHDDDDAAAERERAAWLDERVITSPIADEYCGIDWPQANLYW